MTAVAVVGWGVVGVALALNVALVLWARRITNLISERKLASARDIVKDLRNER